MSFMNGFGKCCSCSPVIAIKRPGFENTYPFRLYCEYFNESIKLKETNVGFICVF